MSLSTTNTNPNFFGKDSFVPFIGQIEDVDDPKRSGRVKVRCLGWHPEEKNGEDGLTTEDLPWARTCMPVTHPQQMRVGGKHGLLPGSWVIGFFADGDDANDPFVFGSFNFTAHTSEENNRKKVDVGEGKLPEEEKGFQKSDPINTKNSGIFTTQEYKNGEDDSKDPAHDAPALEDSTNGECPMARSHFTDEKEKSKSANNPQSQNFSIEIGDGLCGNLKNGRAIIADSISSLLPDGVDRIIEGDDIFDSNGNIINLNAIVNRLAGIISSSIRDTIQNQKAFIQKTINKKIHSTGIYAAATRSPLTAQLADSVLSVQFDLFNSLLDKFAYTIESVILSSLQNINNQQSSSKGPNNLTGEYGMSLPSVILDLDPINIADAVIVDIDMAFNVSVDESNKESEETVRPIKEKIIKFDSDLSNTNKIDYECEDDMNDEINNSYTEIQTDISNVSSQDMTGGFDLSAVSQYLQMILEMDFTLNPAIFNRSGLAILDTLTRSGCNPYDMYHTIQGYTGSIAGVGNKNTGGGSESGKSSKRDKDVYSDIGFGGKPGRSTLEKSTNQPLIGEPRIKKIKQSVRKDIIRNTRQFSPVDYYEEGRTYDFRGEVSFNGTKTKESTVLVNNQNDQSENGIYVTSKYEWSRSNNADKSSEFKRKKIVFVKTFSETEGLFYYSGKQNPKIGYDDIEFSRVHISNEFTRDEKDALNKEVEITPDGMNGRFFCVSKPSSDRDAALNFVYGIPNAIVISNPGKNYYFDSKDPRRTFPSIVIEGYVGTPVPVVDPNTGELVTILINYNSFGNKSNPSTSVIEDDSSIGVSSEDPNYDIILAGFYVVNTGNGYDKNTIIRVIDKDRKIDTAIVKPKVRNGRISYVEVINNGTGFKRIPKIIIENTGNGKGCKLYPIMGLKSKESNSSVKKLQRNVALSISPSPTNVNLFTKINEDKL